jgi:hypothetical protein
LTGVDVLVKNVCGGRLKFGIIIENVHFSPFIRFIYPASVFDCQKTYSTMKLKSLILFLLVAPAVIFLTQGCDKCTESGTITISPTAQFFEATYLVDSNSANYAQTVWRPNAVSVVLSQNGSLGPFAAISEDLSDGKIGPYPFTTSPANAQKGNAYHYMYIVTKDTFGVDTFEVKFYPAVDECHEYWGTLEYYKDGELISTCEGKESCSIEIRE